MIPISCEKLRKFQQSLSKKPIMRRTAKHIDELYERFGNEYADLAERVLKTCDTLGWDARSILSKVFVESLEEMAAFLETGEFGHNFEDARKNVYENVEYMEQEYLPGLFIAYAFTPLLYPKYPFFRNRFTTRLNSTMQGGEVGFGDGFYLWTLCHEKPGITPWGFDISPSAIRVATRVLESDGVEGLSLALGNVLEYIPIPDASQDYGILAEVIEHIPTPEKGVAEMARMLRPGGLLFVSTTKDYNHPDHVTNWPSVEYVAAMLEDQGFAVEEQKDYKVQDDYPESPDKSVNMAFICVKR